MKSFIRRYPVASYYVLTLLISWGGLTLLIGGPGRISSHATDFPLLPLYFITVSGPVFAGILLTGFCDGMKGYREFFSRLFKWRIPARWYSAALFIAPLSVFFSLFILSLASPVFMPGIFAPGTNPVASAFGIQGDDKIMLFLFVLMIGLFNGFVEEVGWTGFVTPRLRQNQNLVSASISLGIMWGVWHLFSNYLGSAGEAGSVPLPLYLAVMLFSFLPPFRIIMIWVYRNTESLLIGILMHASLDVFWMLSMPVSLTGKERMVWYILWAVVLWGLVLLIVLRSRKKSVV